MKNQPEIPAAQTPPNSEEVKGRLHPLVRLGCVKWVPVRWFPKGWGFSCAPKLLTDGENCGFGDYRLNGGGWCSHWDRSTEIPLGFTPTHFADFEID